MTGSGKVPIRIDDQRLLNRSSGVALKKIRMRSALEVNGVWSGRVEEGRIEGLKAAAKDDQEGIRLRVFEVNGCGWK